jgi:DNA modification methylase
VSVTLLRADAGSIPLADGTVDLVVTSPPYWALRSYTDGGEHYDGQIGAEPTPAAYVDSLIRCTAEWMRVLKPGGSIWVNLGDKYSTYESVDRSQFAGEIGERQDAVSQRGTRYVRSAPTAYGVPFKSLFGMPWRYALRCIDDLGLTLRAEVIWEKPNGLPESVTDRVRRAHETWFHMVKQPRYFAAVDAIREPSGPPRPRGRNPNGPAPVAWDRGAPTVQPNPLGRLPGSVREVATQPLKVPAELGVDHFAAFPMDWPRWIIQGWSPSGICTACGEGRRPVAEPTGLSAYALMGKTGRDAGEGGQPGNANHSRTATGAVPSFPVRTRLITGEACACPAATAPTRPSVVLDPFGGTGTTALVAHALGRHGISVDMSADYCRLAAWRTTDPGQLAAAMQVEKPPPVHSDQLALFAGGGAA